MHHNKLNHLFFNFISLLTYNILVGRDIIHTFALNSNSNVFIYVCSHFCRYSFFYIFMY